MKTSTGLRSIKKMIFGILVLVFAQEAFPQAGSEVAKINASATSISSTNVTSTNASRILKLNANYPNPFSGITTISYELYAAGMVKLTVFDATGKLFLTLIDEKQNPGNYMISFNAMNYPNGIYYYSIESGGIKATMKMIVEK